jgi:GNAT superfamily N-acetyltransferase
MSSIIIRTATLQDADAIVPLWREMMEVHQDVEPAIWTMSEDADQNWRKFLETRFDNPESTVLVAEHEGCLIGYLIANRMNIPPVFAAPPTGGIMDCAVTQSQRRRGIGELLVKAALHWFRSQGIEMVHVGYASNNPMSSTFWVKMGFQPFRIAGFRYVGEEIA